jgi:hypothetical protein
LQIHLLFPLIIRSITRLQERADGNALVRRWKFFHENSIGTQAEGRTQTRFFLEDVLLRLAVIFVRLSLSLPSDRMKALMTASAAAAAAAFAAAVATRDISALALPMKLFFFAIVFPLVGQIKILMKELAVTH